MELPLEANYNVAPTQAAYVITNEAPHTLQQLRWGLVPFWDKTGKPSGRMINARAETIAEKPAFRQAWQKRRCLVPADSFYEWQRVGKEKIPFRIRPADGDLLVFAGIWEINRAQADQPPLLTFSILTTEPNAEMQSVHDRMPVLLPQPEQQTTWLNDFASDDLQDLLRPAPDGSLQLEQVSQLVNSVRNNGPELHQPAL